MATTTPVTTSSTSVVTTTAPTTANFQMEHFVQGDMKWDKWIQRLEIGLLKKRKPCVSFGSKSFRQSV